MSADHFNRSFHEALAKAFAARNPQVRAAYFDLAIFYREKLKGMSHLYALPVELGCTSDKAARRRGRVPQTSRRRPRKFDGKSLEAPPAGR